jgi:hypothetical protein
MERRLNQAWRILRPASSAILAAVAIAWFADLSTAMVGGARPADPGLAAHVVMITGSRGNFCSGTVLKTNVVLTAAHCALPGDVVKVIVNRRGQSSLLDVNTILRHPEFDLAAYRNHRATADAALLILAGRLPDEFVAARLAPGGVAPKVGDELRVAGFGVATLGDGRSAGALRTALLTVIGKPGTLQVRLVDPLTRNQSFGLGACDGDSGAPVFNRLTEVVGLVSWTTGPGNESGCGGLTGVTPLTRYQQWILSKADELGASKSR